MSATHQILSHYDDGFYVRSSRRQQSPSMYATRQLHDPSSNSTISSSSTGFSSPPWSHSRTTLKGSLASAEHKTSIYAEKYFPSPFHANYNLGPEADDVLHDPRASRKRLDDTGSVFTVRGCLNIGTLLIIACALLMLFAGYPIMTEFFRHEHSKNGGYGLGGTNATGQLPQLNNVRSLIDEDTPKDVYERMSLDGKKKMKLVFSDEFNKDGRSFYPGDDPFWEAVNLHYWGTGNYEWYDPAAVTTQGGNLVFTLSETVNHNMNFRGGMISSWNQFCFTGGYIEVRALLPGSPDISGLWPAAWTMGNLGRAGYGATNEGMWPYTYNECDVGTLANQTWPDSMGGGPVAAETTGGYFSQYGSGLSYLPGQRLSRCTCPNSDDHPGPKNPDGSFVGRSAPEIDIIEAQASTRRGGSGHVSMTLQVAPYDAGYNMTTAAGAYDFYDPQEAELNTYTGSVFQQSASGLVVTRDEAYEDTGREFDEYGFEYTPGTGEDAHVTWTRSDEPKWRLNSMGIGPNVATEIGARSIPYEPMYIIMNLGMSSSFTYVNFRQLHFPAKYYVDHVRVWQPEGEENIGCDPPDMPTASYIERHWEAYQNPNLTIWQGTPDTGGYGGKV